MAHDEHEAHSSEHADETTGPLFFAACVGIALFGLIDAPPASKGPEHAALAEVPAQVHVPRGAEPEHVGSSEASPAAHLEPQAVPGELVAAPSAPAEAPVEVAPLVKPNLLVEPDVQPSGSGGSVLPVEPAAPQKISPAKPKLVPLPNPSAAPAATAPSNAATAPAVPVAPTSAPPQVAPAPVPSAVTPAPQPVAPAAAP